MNRSELSSLILMKRIFPKEFSAYHIKEGMNILYSSLSEIGYFSSVLFDMNSERILRSENIGILIRTKVADSFEGGVSAGFAVMNSPIIYDN
jgi:glutathione synthase